MTDAKLPQTPETYDDMFRQGGYAQIFRQHYRDSSYYPLFDHIERALHRRGLSRVLEVGCGTGAFAHLLKDRGDYHYRGFDFSREAVAQAAARTAGGIRFGVGDARDADNYEPEVDYDAIVCTEVLEHVPEDLAVIANWPPGKFVMASVPNFDSRYHVRYFRDPAAVKERYCGALVIDAIDVIPKPYLADISFRSYWRALRWARYRPAELRRILGFGPTEERDCWFLVVGSTKR
jgi:SAM-dependent methyltransferase